jgi:hypothetical protein
VTPRLFALLVLITPTLLLASFQEPRATEPGPPKSVEELRQLPIAVGNGEIVKLLQSWQKDGTAAGNVGDWYDNRDGEHSPLDLKPWPQLQKVHYTAEMLKDRVNWAGQRKILPHVVFGNSSTSAPAAKGGSNPRQYYTSPAGLAFLAEQYAKNNLYIYPEHRDHDPGRNGVGPKGEEGYGDLYPTNTPYLIISQGSSGSDQPFMRAIPYVLAAFRPDVKAKLIEAGMLMPTVQMIFRSSNKHLQEGDYLTAKAHPSVFEGSWVDPLKMVTKAHDLTLDTVPPLVRLTVIEEDEPRPGIDYCDVPTTEKLGDTPAVVARVFRGKDRWRRMIVSAQESRDLGNKPLTFEWKVFRGDPATVKITPKNAAGSIVEIQVAQPTRRPIAPGSPMESSRTEIGVFASNGKNWSAPAFITWHGLESETRTYDAKDRPVEIASPANSTRIVVKNWSLVLDPKYASWFPPLTKEQTGALAKGDKDDPKRAAEFVRLFAGHQARLEQLMQSPLSDNLDYQEAEAKADKDERAWIQATALRNRGARMRPEPTAKDRPLEAPDRDADERLNAERLARIVFPGALTVQQQANVADPRLSIPRTWRDVFLYDEKGQYVGWTRIEPKAESAFTADGLVVVDRDDLGRCKTAKNVTYTVERQPGVDRMQLTWAPGKMIATYEYAGPDDRRGKISSMKAP